MSGYKSFAIWGAGHMGRPIIDAFLALKASGLDITVVVLTREESLNNDTNKALAAAGAKIIPFDVTSASASDSLKDIDVFITAIGGRTTLLQPQAAEVCAKAGVKLFIPASWGDRIWERDGVWHRGQQAAHAAADKVGIKTAAFFCGFWPEWFVDSGMYEWDLEAGKMTITGEGKEKISMTSKPDTGRFVAHALTTFPREKLEGGEFYIEAQCISMLELTDAIQAASKKPLEVIITGHQHIMDRLAANEYDIVASLCYGCDTGRSDHHKFVSKVDNDLWPEWKPKSAVEILVAMLPK